VHLQKGKTPIIWKLVDGETIIDQTTDLSKEYRLHLLISSSVKHAKLQFNDGEGSSTLKTASVRGEN
jgi:hypothetical protein